MSHRLKYFIYISIISLLQIYLFFSPCVVEAIVNATQVRHWTAPDHTRVVIDIDDSVYYRTSSSPDKNSIIVELKDCKNTSSKYLISVFDPVVKQINLYDLKENILKIKVDLFKPLNYKVFSLKKYLDKSDRIVIDIFRPEKEKEKVVDTTVVQRLKKENVKIVVIDPGHGGEDPGAIGPRGTKEKDIVLSVGKKLRDLINKQTGIQAYLTRSGDYFIPLTKRIQIATKYKADIFISLHADASRRKAARGTAVFYLSEKGASDEAAKLLAEKENASDLIGGITLTGNPKVDPILVDMSQNLCRNDSLILSNTILNHLSKIKNIHCNGVKYANFVVLKSAGIPSVLLEIAFISNKQEEKYLRDSSFQNRVARSLTDSIRYYFDHQGDRIPEANLVWSNKIDQADSTVTPVTKDNKYKIHVVKKGETLWRISHSYGIALQILRQLNNIGKKNTVKVGQKLKIPFD